jgi:hypothetical protein
MPAYIDEAREALRLKLWGANDEWTADYGPLRLRHRNGWRKRFLRE